ncbi:MAG TPA: molybdopterin biosynthesis protein [Anaerolineales bacterium]|nr:molybdopterin biosynthesis protein [Anaerolineales bacterium]
MSVYLHDIPLDQAKARFDEALHKAGLGGILGAEEIPLDENALGRVLAEPVWAKLSSPHYHASAMDGFAVRAKDTDGASPSTPVMLRFDEQTVYVDTGDPLPDWANAVIPIEETEPLTQTGEMDALARSPYAIRIRAATPPWKHVRPMGEDMVATELVLPAGHVLRPVDLGACAGSGHHSLCVARKPKVAILPTGTELKPIGEPVQAGDIIEYNSVVLAAQVRAWGGEPARFPITADDFEQIKTQVIEAAREHDLVLLLAGSSAGSEDFSAQVVEAVGTLLVHGIAVRPGHPVILGMVAKSANQRISNQQIGNQKSTISNLQSPIPIIGIPGYPVSAALTGEIFVEPLLARWLGRTPAEPLTVPAQMTRKVTSPGGDDDYLRVVVGQVGERTLAAPVSRGAGVISSLVRADGIVILPRGSQGVPAGEEVQVRLYRSPREIERTIFAIGSHDMTLDLLAQYLAGKGRRLVSANVGSQGGLVALKREEAHLAGSHLLDPETGEYNLSYIQRYLPEVPVVVITLVGREQGLIIPRGNPAGVRGIADLAGQGVRFVNRQRGAGTRVLLDYHLSTLGIEPEQVQGYDQEEYTHLAVAAAVASGRADCGLGIAAAAQALGLDFLALFQERYDLIIPEAHYNSPLLAPLLEMLADGPFREAVAKLPGYNVTQMGKIITRMEA